MSTSNPSSRNILTLEIRDKATLYASFMPFVRNGGLFVPTTLEYRLGEQVFLLLSLMDERERQPVSGSVIWITPRGAQGGRPQGIGIQFLESDNGATRAKIETLLAGISGGERPVHTM